MTKMCMRCGYKVHDDVEKCPLCEVDFNEVTPKKVGLFGDGSKQRRLEKEFEEKYNVDINEMKDNLLKKTFFKNNNIFEGIPIGFWSPEKDIIIKQHSGLTKGVATLGLGLVGLAATSGVKQETKRKFIRTTLQVVDAGIILKNASHDNKDVRMPFEAIKSIEYVSRAEGRYKLILLENQTFYFTLFVNVGNQKEEMMKFFPEYKEQIIEIINERAKGNENPDEIKWDAALDSSKQISEPQEPKQESGSLMDELERR